jgi:uncharacterized membrane protein
MRVRGVRWKRESRIGGVRFCPPHITPHHPLLLPHTHTPTHPHTHSAVLLPIWSSLAVAYWLLSAVDRAFAPLYRALGVHVFGLGAVTAFAAVVATGAAASSYVGSAALGLGEWVLRRLPLVSHVYSAAKQVSAALDPTGGASSDGGSPQAGPFRECVLFPHPRMGGALMLGFVTGSTTLTGDVDGGNGEPTDLLCVYAPTNHAYVGDTFLLPPSQVRRVSLSVRDGLEAIVSVGLGLPRGVTVVGDGRGLVGGAGGGSGGSGKVGGGGIRAG